jgi:signal recognition particle receptor subunit beta
VAVIDPLLDTVVIRVVYDGAPMAGKTTSVRMLAKGLGGEVVAPAEIGGRTLYFDWLDYTGGLFEGRRIRCQIVSVPGQASLASRRRHLLESADAVVFVGDSTRDAHESAVAYLKGLKTVVGQMSGPPVGVVLQANKRDHPDAVPLARMREMLDASDVRVAIIESVATEGAGIREAFVFAVRLALDRVRELMKTQQLLTARPDVDTPDELMAELKRVEGGALQFAADSGLVHTRLQELEQSPMAVQAFAEVLRGSEDGSRSESPAIGPSDAPPRLPDSDVPGGMIWPPVRGRMILHEATTADVPLTREANGDWTGMATDRWRIQSPAAGSFETLAEARDALLGWARTHASGAAVISESRCVVLAKDGPDRYRLWQVVGVEPALRDTLNMALGLEPELIADALVQAAHGLLQAADAWRDAPCRLPLSLRRVALGAHGPRFVGHMPYPAPAAPLDPKWEAIVRKRLLAELAFALPAVRGRRTEILEAVDRSNTSLLSSYADAARTSVRELLAGS